jgi:coenzyme F420-reducing hydrogenase alpha subunit
VSETLLNRIEMVVRACPCLGCATHARPGSMPMLSMIRVAS